MYTRPADIADAFLADALVAGWQLPATRLEYRAVGFGSHHWQATADDERRWFVTVDDLNERRQSSGESPDESFDRLRAALATVQALGDRVDGLAIAPVPALDGAIVRRISERYALALYPYVDGQSLSGEYETAEQRLAVLDLVVAVHATRREVTRKTRVEDFALANRDELDAALDDLGGPWELGPYSEPARELLAQHARGLERLLAHHDRIAHDARARPERLVLTHGEPHIENVIWTASGPVLIDWDTTLIAPPERDLWMLDAGDGALAAAYADRTDRPVSSTMLDFYRLCWDLAEVAVYIARFRGAHADDTDSRVSWDGLRLFLDPERRWPVLM